MESTYVDNDILGNIKKWNTTKETEIELYDMKKSGSKEMKYFLKFDSNNVLITIGIDEYILVESELYSFDSLNVKLMDNYGIGWNVLLEEIMKVVNKDKSCLSDISDDNPMNIDHPVQKRIKESIDFAYLKKEYSKMIVKV